jgi:hypothetical protein
MHNVHVLSSHGLFQLRKALSIDIYGPLHLLKEPPLGTTRPNYLNNY